MVNWEIKKFELLTIHEFYAIIQLRNEVFVVEQNCVYQDADDKDQLAYHYMGWRENKLVAYTRLIPPGVSYAECSIGRVVTSSSARGEGLGKMLMQNSIEKCKQLFGNIFLKISAQVHLKNFYASLGFVARGEIYLEDGIQHIEMLLS
jgi:ElaA protein